MPKPILKRQDQQDFTFNLSPERDTRTRVDPIAMERRLRERRSEAYIQAVKQMDLHGATLDQRQYDEFVQAVKNEFPDVFLQMGLLGIVSECFLGKPYDVHTLDLAGNIVVHYKKGEGMPPLLERARSLALHADYLMIEVYADCLRAVKTDGSVSVAK